MIGTRIALLLAMVLILLHSTSNAAASAQHDLYTGMLQDYVQQGRVNYRLLCKDSRLEKYIAQLRSTDPDRLANDRERLALWINAYNAYTLKVICDRYPVKSINDLHTGGLVLGSILNTTIWDKDVVIINNKNFTLNQIEHEIIRPVFKDPRAHFALVCASKSCPPLRREAFEGITLDKQLDEQGRIFLSDPKQNRFDMGARKAYLSKIFDWYGKDFGRNEREVLNYVSRFLPDETAKAIRSDVEEWDVKFLDYDWSLNE